MRSALFAIAVLSTGIPADAQDVREEAVLEDFVPTLDLLERVPASEIEAVYSGTTFAGIYQVPFRADQRFVETHRPDGVSDYVEGKDALTGTWGVENRKLCFRYTEDGNRAHCWTIYRYGGCYVAYTHAHPVSGDPLFLSDWGYIQKEVDDGFRWPARTISDDDVFTCEFAVS